MNYFVRAFHFGPNNENIRVFNPEFSKDYDGSYTNPSFHGASMDAPEYLPSGASSRYGWNGECEFITR